MLVSKRECRSVSGCEYVNRTSERRRRTLFNANPEGRWRFWPIFCVARFSRTDLSMLVARALKIGKIADGGMPPTYETMH